MLSATIFEIDHAYAVISLVVMGIYDERFSKEIPLEQAKKFIEVYTQTCSAAVACKIVGLRPIHVRRRLALDPQLDEAYRLVNDVAKESLRGVLMDRFINRGNIVVDIK